MNHCLYILSLLFVITLCDIEHVSHGASSSKFRNEHILEGKHNAHSDHEAIIGSKKEAKEFDQLAPEESKKRLRILASQMDTNNDKYVDMDELTKWIHTSLLSINREESSDRFLELDRNKDGFVSWDEYFADTYDNIEYDKVMNEEDSRYEEDRRLIKEDKRYFETADFNNDGKLDADEFGAFNNPEMYERMHTVIVKLTMLEKDKNGDGKISLPEFLDDIGENEGSEWYSAEKNRFENEYDIDKNGFLEGKEELASWLLPDIMITAKEEAKYLFLKADKNYDGRLNFDEIVDQYDVFVGSEATNYGEKLKIIDHNEL